MNKYLIAFFLLPLPAISQVENALLWKISKKGDKNVSYLFGSIHTNDSTANTFSQSWWKAFDSCDVIASEVDFTKTDEILSSLDDVIMKDTILSDLYSKEEMAEVNDFLLKEFDPSMLDFIYSMKPFQVLGLVMEKPEDNASPYTIMDLRLQLVAKEKGKDVVGLETPREQSESIDVLTLQEQADMLLQHIREKKTTDAYFERLLGFYLKQRIDSLVAMEDSSALPDRLKSALVDGRNERFNRRLLEQIHAGKKVFCVVGTLHLVGPTGMIAVLRKKGYRVEPVEFHFGDK